MSSNNSSPNDSSAGSGTSQSSGGRASRLARGDGRSVDHAARACDGCRVRKVRCDGNPQSACATCQRHNVQCKWEGRDLRRPEERYGVAQNSQQANGYVAQAQFGSTGVVPVSAYHANPQGPAGAMAHGGYPQGTGYGGQRPANAAQGGHYAPGVAPGAQQPQYHQSPNQPGYVNMNHTRGNNTGNFAYNSQAGQGQVRVGHPYPFEGTEFPQEGFFDGEEDDPNVNPNQPTGHGYYRH